MNAKRAIVTLFGIDKQYVIAEATKTLSLLSDAQHIDGDELWFGNAFIERREGVSADAMTAENFTAYDPDGSTFTAPALVVGDISVHEIYKTRAYAGHGINFYSGVPITTYQGHVIGAYTVTDDKPRDGITATELHFLVDMSVIVMQHLETVKNDQIRKRGERLIQGIGGFIEGDAVDESQPTEEAESKTKSDSNDQLAPLAENPVPPESPKNNKFYGMHITDANVSSQNPFRGQDSITGRPGAPLRLKSSDTQRENLVGPGQKPLSSAQKASNAKAKVLRESQQVFDRAATILRYCLDSDGVVFLDASSANLSSGSNMESSGPLGKLHHSKSKVSRRSEPQNQSQQNQRSAEAVSTAEAPVSSDESTTSNRSQSDSSSSQKNRRQKVPILGRSVRDPSSTISVPEQALRRFVRRHPKGKSFVYDQFGNPASSDESSETASANDVVKIVDGHSPTKPVTHVPTTSALLKALPGARTIVFLPLWDFAKDRWHSGMVIWTNNPSRLTNVEDNMTYLKAFNNAVINEVNRIDLALSDTAKATFLANISHELRSPLHGILGSIEFLHDTAMDDFQSSMIISVETCSKTLLDTVNHVLDYTKIHHLSKGNRQTKGGTQNKDVTSRVETSLTEDFDMAIVVEEAVEAVYAGQVFRTANADAIEGKSLVQTAASRAMQQRQERRDNISKGSAAHKSPVYLTFNVNDNTDWRVRSQPGAVRRVVMNILGNALKYTSKGCIHVSLGIDVSRSKTSPNRHMLLQISDTGQGMRNDFLKNHAFTAFSQENSLATGTGLGLSIVRQIVDSLGGKIELSSEKDVGTEVRIWLSLPKSQKEWSPESDHNIIPAIREKTAGLEMCMLLPYPEKNVNRNVRSLMSMPTVESSMRDLLAQWFKMKVTSTTSMDGMSPDFFIYPEPPPIDYLMDFHGNPDAKKEIPVIILCINAFEAASLRSNGIHRLTDIGRVIEVVAQPCGPQKLAKVLHRCMQRLLLLEKRRSKNSFSNEPLVSRSRLELFKNAGPIEGISQRLDGGKEPEGPDQGETSSQLGIPCTPTYYK